MLLLLLLCLQKDVRKRRVKDEKCKYSLHSGMTSEFIHSITTPCLAQSWTYAAIALHRHWVPCWHPHTSNVQLAIYPSEGSTVWWHLVNGGDRSLLHSLSAVAFRWICISHGCFDGWVSLQAGFTFQEFPKAITFVSTTFSLVVKSSFWLLLKVPHKPQVIPRKRGCTMT